MTRKIDEAMDLVREMCYERGVKTNKIIRRGDVIDVYIGNASDFDKVPRRSLDTVVVVRVCVPAKGKT